jgi:hypothetical protein
MRSEATGSVKAVLAAAKPSTDGSKLVIVCESEVSADSLKSEADDLKAILERELKKEVTFEIYGPSKGEDPDTKYPDLEDHINFDVEINDKF